MKRRYQTHDARVDEAINRLVTECREPYDRELLREMITSIMLLDEDEASTGDLKILNASLKELRYAFKVFHPYRRMQKVAMFGSARTAADQPAYAMATRFAQLMTESGWGIITGAASGIMRAGHEGAGRDASFGLNIRLPFEQEANPVIAEDKKLVNCKYFFTRKLIFIKESHATVLFPGGFGTLDEGFESLTLVQTGKAEPRPTVFVDTPEFSFWEPMLAFLGRNLVESGMISEWDTSLYTVTRSAEEACRHILDFYSVYHSSRYVRDMLVMRLRVRLPDSSVADLSREFADMLVDGAIRQSEALPEEKDDPAILELPRLLVPFDRHRYGRLMQMIARINAIGRPILPGA